MPLAIRRAREVLVADQPMLVAAQSLTSALTLMIVAFSSAYYVLGTKYPSQVPGVHTKIDGLYFSVTILSTVGFGDITATGQGARALVTVNMIVNLVLVALSVRVVSWALSRTRGQEDRRAEGLTPADLQSVATITLTAARDRPAGRALPTLPSMS